MTIPGRAAEFAINTSNYRHWDAPVRAFIDDCLPAATGRAADFNMRWIGSLVAEAYRILMRGGVFLYPADPRPGYREGRLRLLYEAYPIAMIVEQAGGAAIDGSERILDLSARMPASARAADLRSRGSPDVDVIHERHASRLLESQRRAPLFARRGLFRLEEASMSGSIRSSPSPAPPAPARPRSRRPLSRSSAARSIDAAYIEGDAFHRYDRAEMRAKMAEEAERGNKHFSHFGPEANLFEDLEQAVPRLRRDRHAARRGTTSTTTRKPRSTARRPAPSRWERLPDNPICCSTKACTAPSSPTRSTSRSYADLKIGVVPVINLEWIQKLHRDRSARGYSTEAVTDTILRRMPDYVNYICPQFTETDINFQRVPTVDTSNPFIARWIPTPDESMVVIRFGNPRGIDFPYLLSMLPQQLHVARQLDRHARREARPRDAADPHAADPAAHRAQARR